MSYIFLKIVKKIQKILSCKDSAILCQYKTYKTSISSFGLFQSPSHKEAWYKALKKAKKCKKKYVTCDALVCS